MLNHFCFQKLLPYSSDKNEEVCCSFCRFLWKSSNEVHKSLINKRKVDDVKDLDEVEHKLAKKQFVLYPKTTAVVAKPQIYKGKTAQICDVYIGRVINKEDWSLPKSKRANPFPVGQRGSAEKTVEKYEEYLQKHPTLLASISELRGKVLGYWCKPGVCHGDIDAKLANKNE
jgi:hypothetical protein